jgi:hypothetical protein
LPDQINVAGGGIGQGAASTADVLAEVSYDVADTLFLKIPSLTKIYIFLP